MNNFPRQNFNQNANAVDMMPKQPIIPDQPTHNQILNGHPQQLTPYGWDNNNYNQQPPAHAKQSQYNSVRSYMNAPPPMDNHDSQPVNCEIAIEDGHCNQIDGDDEEMIVLKQDFDLYKLFTLLDDEAVLDQLYFYEDFMELTNFAAVVVSDLYMQKYQDMFEKYDDLKDIVLQLCMSLAVESSEQFIKKCSGKQNTQRFGPAYHFARTYNLKQVTGIKRSFTAQGSNADADPNKPQHPFLNTKFYKKYSMLFAIGKSAAHLVPVCFAPCVLKLNYCNQSKYNGPGQTTSKLYGVQLNFEKSIIGHLKYYTNKDYTFFYLGNECISALMQKTTTLTCNDRNFNIGKPKKIESAPVEFSKPYKSNRVYTQSNDIKADMTLKSCNTMVIIKQAAGFQTSAGRLNIKAFPVHYFILYDDDLMTPEEFEELDVSAAEDKQRTKLERDYKQPLKEYLNSKIGLDQPTKKVASSSRTTQPDVTTASAIKTTRAKAADTDSATNEYGASDKDGTDDERCVTNKELQTFMETVL